MDIGLRCKRCQGGGQGLAGLVLAGWTALCCSPHAESPRHLLSIAGTAPSCCMRMLRPRCPS